METEPNRLITEAEKVVTQTVAQLPDELLETALAVSVSYEGQPDAALIAEGIDPGTLGLFTGPDRAEHEGALDPFPPQITIFVENLYLFAGYDEEIYRDEVRTTYLHELGHYLGLDEDDLTARGLE